MAKDDPFLDSLVSAFHRNVGSDDEHDPEVADELLASIKELSPEAYKKIDDDNRAAWKANNPG
ncbi:MAG: hypothetical protein ABIO06_05715 [Pseudolysinimonas sp.]